MNDGALLARRCRGPGRGAPLFHDRPPPLVRGAGVPVRGTRSRLDACDGAPVGRTGRLDNLRKLRPPMPFGAALDDTPAVLP